jgi:hypothetical protein
VGQPKLEATMSVSNQGRIASRAERGVAAANLLSEFIDSTGLTRRAFAKAVGIGESTLRYFLNNACPSPHARRHKNGPYKHTLRPVLALELPDNLREALTQVVDYEDRAVARLLGNTQTAQSPR